MMATKIEKVREEENDSCMVRKKIKLGATTMVAENEEISHP